MVLALEAALKVIYLLFRLFVLCRSPAPFAVLLEFNFLGDKLFVLAGPVICTCTLGAGKLYELIL
jgi:hypothetical protein